jgi:hypothetical protein
MKTIFTSVLFGALFTTLAWPAQPSRSTGRRGFANRRPEARTVQASPNGGDSLLVYGITVAFEFGAIDLHSGTFLPIGTGLPPNAGDGLIAGPRTSLLSLGFDGNLLAIDPATGATSVVGPTGLGDCSTPASPCGPNSANWLGYFDGKYYAVDFAQNLYSLNPETGATKLIGPTGIPPLTFAPFSPDPDGVSFDVFGETLFSFQGKFYAYFTTLAVNLDAGTGRNLIPPAIYQIDPKTGHTSFVTFTSASLSTLVNMNDTIYGFDGLNGQVLTVDVATGQAHVVSPLALAPVAGAAPARPGSTVIR